MTAAKYWPKAANAIAKQRVQTTERASDATINLPAYLLLVRRI